MRGKCFIVITFSLRGIIHDLLYVLPPPSSNYASVHLVDYYIIYFQWWTLEGIKCYKQTEYRILRPFRIRKLQGGKMMDDRILRLCLPTLQASTFDATTTFSPKKSESWNMNFFCILVFFIQTIAYSVPSLIFFLVFLWRNVIYEH